MIFIGASETILVGTWQCENGRAIADETTHRIDELTRKYLQKLGTDVSGRDTLYRDPGDGRFWELTYPHSELHGGGPPMLRNLAMNEAVAKYGHDVVKGQEAL